MSIHTSDLDTVTNLQETKKKLQAEIYSYTEWGNTAYKRHTEFPTTILAYNGMAESELNKWLGGTSSIGAYRQSMPAVRALDILPDRYKGISGMLRGN